MPLIAENRPEYQTVMAKSELFVHLLQLLRKQNVDSKTKQAIVSGISSCVRSCPTTWEKLFDLGGVDKIQKMLEDEESHVVVAKAAHFLLACHETLIDPVLPDINHRKELEASILHAYAALLRRVPEDLEGEEASRHQGRNGALDKRTEQKRQASRQEQEADDRLHQQMVRAAQRARREEAEIEEEAQASHRARVAALEEERKRASRPQVQQASPQAQAARQAPSRAPSAPAPSGPAVPAATVRACGSPRAGTSTFRLRSRTVALLPAAPPTLSMLQFLQQN